MYISLDVCVLIDEDMKCCQSAGKSAETLFRWRKIAKVLWVGRKIASSGIPFQREPTTSSVGKKVIQNI